MADATSVREMPIMADATSVREMTEAQPIITDTISAKLPLFSFKMMSIHCDH